MLLQGAIGLLLLGTWLVGYIRWRALDLKQRVALVQEIRKRWYEEPCRRIFECRCFFIGEDIREGNKKHLLQQDLMRDYHHFMWAYVLLGMGLALFLLHWAFPFLIACLLASEKFLEEEYWKQRGGSKMDELSDQLADAMMEMVLFVEAGSIPDVAWQEISSRRDGFLFTRMKNVWNQWSKGRGYEEGLQCFCKLPTDLTTAQGIRPEATMREWARLMMDNRETGSGDFSDRLLRICRQYQSLKKQKLYEAIALAEQRMLMPAMVIFIAILILVLVPLMADAMLGL